MGKWNHCLLAWIHSKCQLNNLDLMFKYCKYCRFLFPISALFWGKVFGNVFCFILQRKINTNVNIMEDKQHWVGGGGLVISLPESEIDDNFLFCFYRQSGSQRTRDRRDQFLGTRTCGEGWACLWTRLIMTDRWASCIFNNFGNIMHIHKL